MTKDNSHPLKAERRYEARSAEKFDPIASAIVLLHRRGLPHEEP